jgi:hypothetical protein
MHEEKTLNPSVELLKRRDRGEHVTLCNEVSCRAGDEETGKSDRKSREIRIKGGGMYRKSLSK